MKLGHEAVTEIIDAAVPRRNRRGLIEASDGPEPWSWTTARVPRRNRRGLIEAPNAATTSGPDPLFPGEIAGASLKQDRRAHFGDASAQFPGEIAGASLKPEPQGIRIGGGLRRFPGEIAGASLKPLAPRLHERAPLRVPRRNRRGLIEARLSRVGQALPPRAFPGEIAGASLKL